MRLPISPPARVLDEPERGVGLADPPVKASGPRPGESTNFPTRAGDGQRHRIRWQAPHRSPLSMALVYPGRQQRPRETRAWRIAAGERRSLRELSGGLLALPAAAASADRRDLPLRPHRRRHRRRRRGDARRAPRRPGRVSRRPARGRGRPRRRRRAGPRCSVRSPGSCTRHRLPVPLLADLLDAFAQDARADALRRPHRAARLLPALGEPDRPPAAASLRHRRRRARWRRSDAICSALQLANFWQDLGVDAARGRLYVPRGRRARHGVELDGAARAARQRPGARASSPNSSPGRAR